MPGAGLVTRQSPAPPPGRKPDRKAIPLAEKTHCRRGHALSGDNVYIRPNSTWRECATCRYAAVKRHKARQQPQSRFCECGRQLRKRQRACSDCRSARAREYYISDEDRAWVYKRDGHACLKCGGDENLTVDHVMPRALGGPDHRSNYQTLCLPCNAAKGASYADYRKIADGQLSFHLTRPTPTLRDRFMAKVDVQLAGCWFWTGARTSTGTPAMNVDGQLQTAPRVAYGLFKGEIPDGQWVYRSCRDSACVAPGHLYTDEPGGGTGGQRQSPWDACAKGHPYTPENVRMDGSRRRCRTCRNEASRRYVERKKQAKALVG